MTFADVIPAPKRPGPGWASKVGGTSASTPPTAGQTGTASGGAIFGGFGERWTQRAFPPTLHHRMLAVEDLPMGSAETEGRPGLFDQYLTEEALSTILVTGWTVNIFL